MVDDKWAATQLEWVELKLERNAQLRDENHRLRSFLADLLDPESLGYQVESEVRIKASQLLKSLESRDA